MRVSGEGGEKEREKQFVKAPVLLLLLSFSSPFLSFSFKVQVYIET